MEALSAFPVESEVWLPPKLLLVPAVPSALSLELLRDPCNSASPRRGERILSPGWGGRAPEAEGRVAGTEPLSLEAGPCSEQSLQLRRDP